ncbi:MAG: alpha-amylase family glycosyl hydrolase [Actinomycetota bacterium]
MAGAPSSRSAFVAALLSVGLIVPACDARESGSGPRPQEPAIAFDVRGGDAFSWSKTVTGHVDCPDVTLENNGAPVGAPVELLDGSTFRAKVPLTPGRNEVVARCHTNDGDAGASQPLVFDARLQVRPSARIAVSTKDDLVVLDGSRSGATRPHGTEVVRYVWTTDPRHPARLVTGDGKVLRREPGPRLSLRAPAEDGEYYVSLTAFDAEGRSDTSTTYFVVKDGRARTVDLMREHPSWIDRAVIYAPIPQLWGNGGPKAVQRRLPYLKKLGVDALWLWPPATERALGEEYAITDYFKLDPSWAPEAEFKAMVDEAHRLGMYTMLDFVPNHLSDQSPYFKDAEKHGTASNYWDFFDRNAQGKYTHYFDWTNLPNLNYDNPEIRNMIIEASKYWVRDLGIDGFRVDVAWGVKRRRPDFWREWRRELKRVNPDLLLLAEATAVDPYYFSHGFDVAYDWTDQPGQWAWTSAFDFPEETGVLLAPAITNGKRGYARAAIVMRFLNNNDTGIRFVDQYGPELTRVAATLQFTLPGVPEMFAGDEIGASYEPYSNLTPIVWRDRFGLRPFYERLIALKHSVAALSSHDVNVLTTNTNSALAYVRPEFGGSGPVLVVLNFGGKARVELAGAPAMDAALGPTGGAMQDLLTGTRVDLDAGGSSTSIAMDAQSSHVLVPAKGDRP